MGGASVVTAGVVERDWRLLLGEDLRAPAEIAVRGPNLSTLVASVRV
jgi:hypothetical protein